MNTTFDYVCAGNEVRLFLWHRWCACCEADRWAGTCKGIGRVLSSSELGVWVLTYLNVAITGRWTFSAPLNWDTHTLFLLLQQGSGYSILHILHCEDVLKCNINICLTEIEHTTELALTIFIIIITFMRITRVCFHCIPHLFSVFFSTISASTIYHPLCGIFYLYFQIPFWQNGQY